MELSNSNIKKKSYTFSKESVSYISGSGTMHVLAQARKIKKINLEKISYILGSNFPSSKNIKILLLTSFLHSRKWKFLIFQGTETLKSKFLRPKK